MHHMELENGSICNIVQQRSTQRMSFQTSLCISTLHKLFVCWEKRKKKKEGGKSDLRRNSQFKKEWTHNKSTTYIPKSPPTIPAKTAQTLDSTIWCNAQFVPSSPFEQILLHPWHSPIAWYRNTPTDTGTCMQFAISPKSRYDMNDASTLL